MNCLSLKVVVRNLGSVSLVWHMSYACKYKFIIHGVLKNVWVIYIYTLKYLFIILTK